MTNFLGRIFGFCFRYVYDQVSAIGTEPENISFYAITIIITTILFRILQLPLGIKQNKETRKMARVQPKIQEIQEKYKNDPNTMNAKLTKLMQEERYNPLAGCLPLLIQMPIIMAFWRVLQNPEVFAFQDGNFHNLQMNFFWLQDLRLPDAWILPFLSAGMTFLSSYLSSKGQVKTQVGEAQERAESMQRNMMIIFPVMIFFMGKSLPSGLALYWTVSNTFMLVQQFYFNNIVKREQEEATIAEKMNRKKKKV